MWTAGDDANTKNPPVLGSLFLLNYQPIVKPGNNLTTPVVKYFCNLMWISNGRALLQRDSKELLSLPDH